LKQLNVEIPWNSLTSSPVKVVVDGLYLIATPSSRVCYLCVRVVVVAVAVAVVVVVVVVVINLMLPCISCLLAYPLYFCLPFSSLTPRTGGSQRRRRSTERLGGTQKA
jgi:hypothetical protein